MPEKRSGCPVVSPEETILQTRVGRVVSAAVQNRRTGKTETFYRFLFSDWVNIIALTSQHEIVLIRQFRYGSGRVELEIPGGAIENGESPLEAGQRELLEETGYVGRNGKVIGDVLPNPAIQNNRCYTVVLEDVKQVSGQNMDEMEDIDVEVVPFAHIDSLIRSGKISHGLVLNALMLYEKARNIR
ncbi:MAG: NUDIX hydrolase [Desulfopila sp.]|nr:NUDIX hydrolase [Desulfopila sp.]